MSNWSKIRKIIKNTLLYKRMKIEVEIKYTLRLVIYLSIKIDKSRWYHFLPHLVNWTKPVILYVEAIAKELKKSSKKI